MASLSLYPQFETNLMSNRKVIELLLNLKSAEAHGKNYIKVEPHLVCHLLGNHLLICYLQRVNATSQYNDSGSSRCSKWPNDRMVAVEKHCWLFVQGRRDCGER